MDVQLYVYDLTRGMAKAMSQQLLGIHIEAVYHTSLVFNGIEYFFGRGVQTCYPGTTHHGQPMEIIPLGSTELPMETILDYLESLKEVYHAESYDLFAHNCNNFSHDFATFLVGRGIPDHITSLPKRVLDTPFGQMLRPQIDAGMRSITQAEVPAANTPPDLASSREDADRQETFSRPSEITSGTANARYGSVINVSSLPMLQEHMLSTSNTCTTIFFTSKMCGPCRIAYPMYDQLAAEHPEALFVKVDISEAHDVAKRYQVRATPTFVTFSRNAKHDEWSGADIQLLKSNVESVIRQTFPTHRHLTLNLPLLQYGSMKPVTYARLPPLDKLMAKLGPAAQREELTALRTFVEKRNGGSEIAPLPNLKSISRAYRSEVLALPLEVRFAAVDLLRLAIIDPRVGGYFAEEHAPKTIPALVDHVNNLEDCPHNLRLVMIHLACNTFASSLYVKELMNSEDTMISQFVQLIAKSLLDASHPTTRVAAASLAFNLATANYRIRREEAQDALAEGEQVELAASLLETISDEQNEDAKKAILLSLGYLLLCSEENGELNDLCRVLDAKAKIESIKGHPSITKEVGSLLLL